jgi:hypothetical protein
MNISKLIYYLQQSLEESGDMDVFVDMDHQLFTVEDVGVDTDDTGFIIWPGTSCE